MNNQEEPQEPQEPQEPLIPRRRLGRTGFYVSVFGLGGAFVVAQDRRDEASAVINRALDLGVNYIDTAPTYGSSERNIGELMRHRRPETFLASKTLDRSRDGTMRLFEQSLKRLQTDHLDLYQLHAVHSEADLKELFGPRGAVKALNELREAGSVKFAGITSHRNCSVLLQALEEYDFDCVLMPLNAGDVHDDSFTKNVLQVARQKDMGVVAMKVAAYGRIFREGGSRLHGTGPGVRAQSSGEHGGRRGFNPAGTRGADFGPIRPPISVETVHSFRTNLYSHFGLNRPLLIADRNGWTVSTETQRL